jgi:hypothetical protein
LFDGNERSFQDLRRERLEGPLAERPTNPDIRFRPSDAHLEAMEKAEVHESFLAPLLNLKSTKRANRFQEE